MEAAAMETSERPAGNAKPAGAKKTKTVRENQEYIDLLLARGPVKPYPVIPEETIRNMIPENQEKVRAIQARIAAIIKATRDKEEDVLEQYRVKGYAEVEVEVKDDVEEGGVDVGN